MRLPPSACPDTLGHSPVPTSGFEFSYHQAARGRQNDRLSVEVGLEPTMPARSGFGVPTSTASTSCATPHSRRHRFAQFPEKHGRWPPYSLSNQGECYSLPDVRTVSICVRLKADVAWCRVPNQPRLVLQHSSASSQVWRLNHLEPFVPPRVSMP